MHTFVVNIIYSNHQSNRISVIFIIWHMFLSLLYFILIYSNLQIFKQGFGTLKYNNPRISGLLSYQRKFHYGSEKFQILLIVFVKGVHVVETETAKPLYYTHLS